MAQPRGVVINEWVFNRVTKVLVLGIENGQRQISKERVCLCVCEQEKKSDN